MKSQKAQQSQSPARAVIGRDLPLVAVLGLGHALVLPGEVGLPGEGLLGEVLYVGPAGDLGGLVMRLSASREPMTM